MQCTRLDPTKLDSGCIYFKTPQGIEWFWIPISHVLCGRALSLYTPVRGGRPDKKNMHVSSLYTMISWKLEPAYQKRAYFDVAHVNLPRLSKMIAVHAVFFFAQDAQQQVGGLPKGKQFPLQGSVAAVVHYIPLVKQTPTTLIPSCNDYHFVGQVVGAWHWAALTYFGPDVYPSSEWNLGSAGSAPKEGAVAIEFTAGERPKDGTTALLWRCYFLYFRYEVLVVKKKTSTLRMFLIIDLMPLSFSVTSHSNSHTHTRLLTRLLINSFPTLVTRSTRFDPFNRQISPRRIWDPKKGASQGRMDSKLIQGNLKSIVGDNWP